MYLQNMTHDKKDSDYLSPRSPLSGSPGEWYVDPNFVGSFSASPAAMPAEDLAHLVTDPGARDEWRKDMKCLEDWVNGKLGNRSPPFPDAETSYDPALSKTDSYK